MGLARSNKSKTAYFCRELYDTSNLNLINNYFTQKNIQLIDDFSSANILLPFNTVQLTEIDELLAKKYDKIPLKIKQALKFSKIAHTNQKRANGNSFYNGHILPIIKYLMLYDKNASKVDIIIATLHDAVEDNSNKNCVEVLLKTFGKDITVKVLTLTKTKYTDKDVQEKTNISKLLNVEPEIQLIKSIDRLHNLMDDYCMINTYNKVKVAAYLNKTKTYYSSLFKCIEKKHPKVFATYSFITKALDENLKNM